MIARNAALLGAALALISLAGPALAATALLSTGTKLLAGPGPTFETIASLDAKTKVGVLWCGPSNFDWCLVSYHKTGGWVHPADLTMLAADGSAIVPGGNGQGSTVPQGGDDAPPLRASPGEPNGISAGSVGAGGVHAVGNGL